MIMILIIIGLLVGAYMLFKAGKKYMAAMYAVQHDPEDVWDNRPIGSKSSRYDNIGLQWDKWSE